jgi:hypothetical protein
MSLTACKDERDYFKSILDRSNFMDLALDPYGSFIIQKLLKMFEDQEVLFQPILDNLDAFINDANGIRVLKQSLGVSESFQPQLVQRINDNILHYTQSEQGSHFVLYLLKTLTTSSKPFKELMTCIIRNIIRLSIHKYSSVVVIKIIEGFEQLRPIAVNELFYKSNKVYLLTKNKFGILVLETIIKTLSTEEKLVTGNIVLRKFNKDEHSHNEFERMKSILEMLCH